MNDYEKSILILKNKLKENPNLTKEDWDQFAMSNSLRSALNIMIEKNAKNWEILKYRLQRDSKVATIVNTVGNNLVFKIEKLRDELHKSIEENGINAEETAKISKKIDTLINKFYKNKKEVEYPESSEMYLFYKKSYSFLKQLVYDFGEFPTVEEWNIYAKQYYLLISASMQYISGCTWHQLRSKVHIEKNI